MYTKEVLMMKLFVLFLGTSAILYGTVVIKEEYREPKEKVIIEKEHPYHHHHDVIEEKVEVKL